MIEHNCPHCNHLLRIKSKYAGQKGGCKHCGGMFVVPGVQISAAPSEEAGLDNMDDLPSLDPAFAQQMADQPVERVEPSTSLDDLKHEPVAEEVVASIAPPPIAQVKETGALGCVFWGAAFLVPPAGLIWSFVLPSGHPEKVKGIVVSSSFSVLAILCVLFSAWLGAVAQELSDTDNAPDEISIFEPESPQPPVTQTPAIPASEPPVRTNDTPAPVRQAMPQGSPQVAPVPVEGPGFENFVLPSYPELYLEFPERLTPAMLGRSLSSFSRSDVRYMSLAEGVAAGTIDEVAKSFQRQLIDQGFEASMSFGFSTAWGEHRKITCKSGTEEWFFVRFTGAADGGTDVFAALYAGDSGLGFGLPYYESPESDPVPAISGIEFAPPELLSADLLDGIDDALSAFDLRNLVIREAHVGVHFEEIAKAYEDAFKAQGWETGMAFGFGTSGDYRILTARRDRWTIDIRVENVGDRQSRIVAVSPLE